MTQFNISEEPLEYYKGVPIYCECLSDDDDEYHVFTEFSLFIKSPQITDVRIVHKYSQRDLRSIKRFITLHENLKYTTYDDYLNYQSYKNQNIMSNKQKSKNDENAKRNRSAEFQYYGQALQGLESMVKIGAGNTTPSSQFTEVLDVIRQAHEKVMLILKNSRNEICDL